MTYGIVGFIAAVLTAIITVKKNALTVPAAIEAMVLIFMSCFLGGWFGLSFLLIVYFSIAGLDLILKKKTSNIFGSINKKSGARDHIQVAANGVAALLCLILFGITKLHVFIIGYAVALTESFADSVASDVGVLSKTDPISICRFKRIPRGLSGGVSLLGTVSSLVAVIFCALLYYMFFRNIAEAAIVATFAFIGCIIDSILGDLLQEKFLCTRCGTITERAMHCEIRTGFHSGVKGIDNCAVNFISNIASTLICLLIVW